MNEHYKITLHNAQFYKEFEISPDAEEVTISTHGESDVRLKKDLFFFPVSLTLKKDKTQWVLYCSDGVYLSEGDIRKFYTKQLQHGDEFVIKYQEQDVEVFTFQFFLDFDYFEKKYDLEIDIANCGRIQVGGQGACDIVLNSQYIGKDTFAFVRRNNELYVIDNNTKFGVYVNGVRVYEKKRLSDKTFVSFAEFSFYVDGDSLYTTLSDYLSINHLAYKRVEKNTTHFEYPSFNRSTRVQYSVAEEKLEIQDAPPKPKKSKKNIVMSLIPSLVMLAMTVVLRGIIGGGGTFVIYSAVSMGIGIIMSVVSFFQEKKEYKIEVQERLDSYQDYIAQKRDIFSKARKDELRIRRLIYTSLDESVYEVETFGKRLFERSPGDIDFLSVYLGSGKMMSANQIRYKEQEFIDLDDPLATIPQEVSNEFKFIENAPITSDFYRSSGVGIIGSKQLLKQFLVNLTLDIIIRHFYNEVKLIFILNDDYIQDFQWLRWVQHVRNNDLDINDIVCDEESRNVILENLYSLLSSRGVAGAQPKDVKLDSYYVVFVADATTIANHPISKYLSDAADYGFTFVFLEEYEEDIPGGCDELIRLSSMNKAQWLNTHNGDRVFDFDYTSVPISQAERIALRIGAINVEEVSLESELTKRITMFELLGILTVEDIDLSDRWSQSQVYKSLAAPLGVKRKNEIVYLDIGDRAAAHGPHGLVAGTTGSGKSEILQTYILSLATLFHPYEVGFVLIDFKGGGMANQFKNLPHLIGTITNIDGREINRSLLSIKAELIKRQELFSESGVNHINDYIRLYKDHKVDTPLPHLIIIVDEFAELKAEYPDFMKELISTARIGRTLGVHLILATQKPSGVVDAQIWSNSKFKLCLKVQSREDSNEVLKTPLAAEIVEPGRAYFQVGNNEIFELFQSAYSGAPIPVGIDSKERTFQLYETNLWGKKQQIYSNKKSGEESSVSQLQAIVQHISDYCKRQNIRLLPGICLPSLPDRISVTAMSYDIDGKPERVIPLGIYDDPEQQYQGELTVDLTRDNVFIVGSSQMGKTVLLQTILYGLMKKYSSEEVNFYIVDCGSMVLKLFEKSNYCGGVVLSSEDEKCINLFKFLRSLILKRKKFLANKGIGNFSSYIQAGYKDLPLTVIVIDNIAAFKEYFSDQYDELSGLVREAQSVGLSFVFTATQSGAINYRMQAYFGKKYVFTCNDTGEYSNVFGHCQTTPKEVPGRGLTLVEKRIMEFQAAVFGSSEREADRSDELKAFIQNSNLQNKFVAPEIPMVPGILSLSETMKKNPEVFKKKDLLPIGMDFENVAFSFVNLSSGGHLALIGDAETGTAFLRVFLKQLSQTIIYHETEAIVIDDRSKSLHKAKEYGFVKSYSSDVTESLDLISDFVDDVMDRLDEDEDDGMNTQILLVINSADVLRKLSENKTESKRLSDTIKSAAQVGAFVLISNIENQTVSFNSPDYLKTIRDERKGIVFLPLRENKLYEVTGRIKNEISFDNSMGYYFDGNKYGKIKLFQD